MFVHEFVEEDWRGGGWGKSRDGKRGLKGRNKPLFWFNSLVLQSHNFTEAK